MPQRLPAKDITNNKPCGFPPNVRLKERRDFLRVKESGKRAHSRHFLVSYILSKEVTRLGIAVTRKIERSAVRRNRLKRFVREFFRLNRKEFLRNADIVVVARSSSGLESYRAVAEELSMILRREKFIRGT